MSFFFYARATLFFSMFLFLRPFLFTIICSIYLVLVFSLEPLEYLSVFYFVSYSRFLYLSFGAFLFVSFRCTPSWNDAFHQQCSTNVQISPKRKRKENDNPEHMRLNEQQEKHRDTTTISTTATTKMPSKRKNTQCIRMRNATQWDSLDHYVTMFSVKLHIILSIEPFFALPRSAECHTGTNTVQKKGKIQPFYVVVRSGSSAPPTPATKRCVRALHLLFMTVSRCAWWYSGWFCDANLTFDVRCTALFIRRTHEAQSSWTIGMNTRSIVVDASMCWRRGRWGARRRKMYKTSIKWIEMLARARADCLY